MKPFFIDFSLRDTGAAKARHDIDQIIAAVRELSRNHIGALLVVEPPEGERDYVSPGTPINADISSALILTIFFPNSPLHDGALVIREDKIVAAGVILPMTDDAKLSYKYGTRHRAAIGLSEIYDGLCIVVSEETGAISAANRGMLVRYNDANELADPLAYLYHQHGISETAAPTPLSSFLTLFSKGRKEEVENLTTASGTTLPPITVSLPAAPDPERSSSVNEQRLSGEIDVSSLNLGPPEPEQVL
jgi:diadenylate cyclase